MPRTSKANQNAQSSLETISLTDDLLSIDDLEQLARQTALEHAKAFSGDDGPRGQSNLVLSEPMNVLIMVEPKLRQFDVSISKGESRDDIRERVRREVERYTRLVVCAPEYFATELSEGTEYELEFPAGCKVTSIGDMLVKHHNAVVLGDSPAKNKEIPFICSIKPSKTSQRLPKGEKAGNIVAKDLSDAKTRMLGRKKNDTDDIEQTNFPDLEVLNSTEEKIDKIVLAFESLPKFEQWSLVQLLNGKLDDGSPPEKSSSTGEFASPIRLNEFAPEELSSHLSSLALREESVLEILAWCVEEIDATPSSVIHKLEELFKFAKIPDLAQALSRLGLSGEDITELAVTILEALPEKASASVVNSVEKDEASSSTASDGSSRFSSLRVIVQHAFSNDSACATSPIELRTRELARIYHWVGDRLRDLDTAGELTIDSDILIERSSAKALIIWLRKNFKVSLTTIGDAIDVKKSSLGSITAAKAADANERTWRKLRDYAREMSRKLPENQ